MAAPSTRRTLVEQNFFNLGIGDHPLQALNALRRGRLRFDSHGKPLAHGEDTGRQEITHDPNHAYKFRSLTLRQLKDARTFFHNGSFSKVEDVVRYFNAGVPQDAEFAGAASTLEPRFTHPRGEHAPAGLGLDEQAIAALSDFLEDGLYDPSFAHDFQPTEQDLAYSTYHPELVALGAKDGQLLSGKAIDNDDPLSRRDQGLEFLDVTAQVRVERLGRQRTRGTPPSETLQLTNTSGSVVDTHLLILVRGLPAGTRLGNASGTSHDGDPSLRVFLPGGTLEPGQRISVPLELHAPPRSPTPRYTLTLLSGQGEP